MKRKSVKSSSPLQIIHQQYFLNKGKIASSSSMLRELVRDVLNSGAYTGMLETLEQKLYTELAIKYIKAKNKIKGV